MSGRASFGPTVLVGLGSAALLAVAASRSWATATTASPGVRTAAAPGSEVAPLALALGLVALACWGTVLVLRRRGRRIVSVLGLLAAVGAVAAVATRLHEAPDVAARALGDVDASMETTAWPWVALVAGVLTAAGFLVALRASAGWPEMSSRYDAPGGARRDDADAELSDRELWAALDEGHDPTA